MLRYSAAFIAACSSSLMLAQPAAAEVVKISEDSFVTRNTAVVEATPYEAWQVLITPSKWWNDNHTWSADAENLYISAQAGGCFCELLPVAQDAPEGIRRGSAHHMTVVLADPPRALRMRGGLGPLQSEPVDGVLTITLSPSGAGTVIVFEYVVGGYMRFDPPEISKAVDGVISQQLAGLAKLLGPVTKKTSPKNGSDEPVKEGSTASEPDGDGEIEGVPEPVIPETKTQSVEEAFGSIDDD